MKKTYDLSVANQISEQRRVLISTNGTEFDISFIPAIVNRKFYKSYQALQMELITLMGKFFEVRKKLVEGIPINNEDNKVIADFNLLSDEAGQSAIDLIMYVLKANGYNETTEDHLFEAFSEADLGRAINFIMGISEVDEDIKKK